MEESLKKQLAIAATRIRMSVINGTYHAKSGHPGGSLSVADLMAYLYFAEMRVDPQNPRWQGRDRLVLSKGHTAPALYGALALKGFFPVEEIDSLRHTGAMLQGHPDMKGTPGVDMSTGSLGQGVSAAVGMALAGKLDNASYRVYTVLGDGEIEEGQVWEAAMFAAHKKLDNLCLIVDNNNLQIDGTLEEVNSPYPIPEKFAAFGFKVIEIDGSDFDQMETAFRAAREEKGRPTAIVMTTVKGKGVSFMENMANWHGAAPNKEQTEQALAELEAALKQLKSN
ncbi:MAG: transketolase [Clostridiales bacterium]|nr:transketolase [Clostridiales bacterium]